MAILIENNLYASIGAEMHGWARDLFPINRSLTGDGVRETLNYVKKILPELTIKSVDSGVKVFDWEVPQEWRIREAWIKAPCGNKIVDFRSNNLHVIGYSEPVHEFLELKQLKSKLYSIPEKPDAIPYVTSYYQRDWGFCLTDKQKKKLTDGRYEVYIDSEFRQGCLNYGEIIIPGSTEKEIFISTYICHPSMANNELSGPVVASALARSVTKFTNRKFTYRFVFIPETIGSIAYLADHWQSLKKNVVAGFNLTCIGDDRAYSFLPSRSEKSLADRVALKALVDVSNNNVTRYSWLDRGSDERQYCSPGIDLPVASIMRSKYGTYPEYHTSLDDLSLVTPTGLEGGLKAVAYAIEILELNFVPVTNILCEPQLGKRGLYESLSGVGESVSSRTLINIISYCDGNNDILDISNKLDLEFKIVYDLCDTLMKFKIIRRTEVAI